MYTCLMSKNGGQWHFKKILLKGGWAENVTVEVGAGGLISGLHRDSKGGGEKISGIAIPAMLNAHSHAFQRAFAGLTEKRGKERDDFWAWRQVMYRAVKAIGPDELEAIAAQVYVEMLKSGYAGVAEFHYLHHQADGTPYDNKAEMSEAIIRAAGTAGIDLTLLPVLYQRSDFGADTVEPGQRPFFNTLEDFRELLAGLKGKCRSGLALHSLRAVPEEVLAEAAALTEGPVHIHIAEQTREVEACLEAHGQRPVEWLLENADVDARWNLVHATHVMVEEVTGLAKSGATVVLCPTTEANLGDGIFPFKDYSGAGGSFAIGSDSQVSIDPREELRLLEYGQRLISGKRAIAGVHPGAALWTGAAAGGAAAMGYEKSGIQVGAPAHIAVLDDNSAALIGGAGDQILDALVFAGQPTPVRDVMVSGAWRVRDFHHPKETAVRARFNKAVKELA